MTPFQEGTSAGRYIERRKGDGGYMVIIQVADAAAERKRVTGLGVRAVLQKDMPEYQYTHFHPSDTSGVLLSLDTTVAPAGVDPALWWPPAEKDWLRHSRSDVTNGLAGVEIQDDDPDKAAATCGRRSSIVRSRTTSSASTTTARSASCPIADGPRAGRVGLRRQGGRPRARAGRRRETRQEARTDPDRGLRLPDQPGMKPLLVIGSYLSPYVRKVLACLEIKGIAYEVDHIVPFFGDDRFSRLSPLRRIPVLVDGDLVLSDSSVICQYLEDKQPAPALLPADIRDRARARWLEEFADTRMGDVFIWRLFNQIAIRPSVWGEKGDRDLVDRTLKEDVPDVLDYLEAEAPAEGFRFGAISVADIAVACLLPQCRLGALSDR